MRSIWSGAITLSLLSLPMKLGSTTKDNSLGLHMVRLSDGSRIKFIRVSEADGKEVPWDEIAKGYDAPDGSLVVLGKKDFDEAYGPKNRVAELTMFTDAVNIPPIAAKTSYFVQPDKGGEKTYALLVSALTASGKVGILTFAMRQREAVAVLRPLDGYLILQALEWDTDLLKPDFEAPPQTATEAEQELALKLIEAMTGDYEHAAFTDRSAEALQAVIQAKLETGQTISPPARPDAQANVAKHKDLMSALTAAIQAKDGQQVVPPARKPRAATPQKENAS